MILNKTLLAQNCQPLLSKDVPVPQWGGDVRLRVLNAGQQIEFAETLADAQKAKYLAFHMITACAIDGQGNQLFEDDSWLRQQDPEIIAMLFQECLKLNKLNEGAVEEDAKNS